MNITHNGGRQNFLGKVVIVKTYQNCARTCSIVQNGKCPAESTCREPFFWIIEKLQIRNNYKHLQEERRYYSTYYTTRQIEAD